MVTGRWKWNPPNPFFWFFSKNVFFTILGWTGQKMRYWIWGPVGFKPEYLLTYLSYLNSDKCILILIEFPLIWYIMGLSRSKFDRFSRVWRSGKFLIIKFNWWKIECVVWLFKLVFLRTRNSYLNFESFIKILIKFPLIWCIVGLGC